MFNSKLIGVRYFGAALKKKKKTKGISRVVVDSTRDTIGHKTFMSSVAAGNFVKGLSFFGYTEGTAKGVAPHARISMYKVSGSAIAESSDIIAGID